MSLRLPSWLQAGSHPAEDDRLTQAALWTPDGANALTARTGVVPGQGGARLLVSAQGTPNMSVQVNAGSAAIQGTNSALQGAYTVTLDATTTVNIPAADPTNPRIDLICITVEDAFYSGTNNDATLHVVSGVPAPSPSAPVAPANSVVLAQVTVGAGVSSITGANIADKRVWVVARGGVLPCLSTARPASPYAGMHIFETDTKRLAHYDGAAWVYDYPLDAWSNIPLAVGYAAGAAVPQYRIENGRVYLRGQVAASGGGTIAAGSITVAVAGAVPTPANGNTVVGYVAGTANGTGCRVWVSTDGSLHVGLSSADKPYLWGFSYEAN